jgi:sarcosine oxidase, subunit delta
MQLIPCPWCGERNESEFLNGGPLKAPRPDDAAGIAEAEWIDRLIVAPNPKGPLVEKWWHLRGCGLWFTLTRDTLTHEIVAHSKETSVGARR